MTTLAVINDAGHILERVDLTEDQTVALSRLCRLISVTDCRCKVVDSEPNMEMNTIGVKELAGLLHKTEATVRRDVTRSPKSLPPRVLIPDSKKLVWLEDTVHAWLKAREQRPMGRPRTAATKG